MHSTDPGRLSARLIASPPMVGASPEGDSDVQLEDQTDVLEEDSAQDIELESAVTPNSSGYDLLNEDGSTILEEDGTSDIELELASTSDPSFCFVDPRAATLILGPGMTVTLARCRLVAIQGYAVDWPMQAWNRGGLTKPIFGQGDLLAGAIYQRGIPTPICTPAVAWYTAQDSSGNPTQNGYQQGQFVVSPANADTTKLQPTGGPLSYTLVVSWSPAALRSKSVEIVCLPVFVTRNY